MENASFNNLENTAGDEEPFEFKNLLSEMFTSSSNQNPSSNSSLMEIPKIVFSSSPNSSTSTNNSSSSWPNIISFGNQESNFVGDEIDYDMISEKVVIGLSSSPTKRICRSPLQSQDHLLAERKRRERFTQLFAVLAKSIPGLKKLDKASILEDSIKYIGELQGRVRVLEEEGGTTKSKNLIESNSTVQKQFPLAVTTSDDDNSFLPMNFDETKTDQNDIKVQILDKNVLIGIHCSKEMRSIFTIIAAIMEKLQLTIHHIRVTPSNHIALHYIYVLAEIDQNVDITVQDVENTFKLALPSTSNRPGLAG